MEDAYRRRDWDAVRRCYHDHARLVTVASDGTPVGPDEMIDILKRLDNTLYAVSAEDATTSIDDHACISSRRVRYPHRGGGFADSAFYWLLTYKDGLLYRSRVFRSHVEATACYSTHGLSLGIDDEQPTPSDSV